MEVLSLLGGAREATVGRLATDPTVVSSATPARKVEELFATDAGLRAIVIGDGPDGPALITRSAFADVIPGTHRFGRELYGRRPISELSFPPTLLISDDLEVDNVSALMLAREPARRYDDALVVYRDGSFGFLQASAVIQALAAQFAYQATHDNLTGLASRPVLAERLRTKGTSPRPTAVLFLDLDRFKIVNDSLGHAAGDRLLQAVGRRIQSCLREEDLACRLGGDEFVVLVDCVDTLEAAEELAERLLATIAIPFDINGTPVHISASIGVSIGEIPGAHPDSLLLEADLAMYAAKDAGKARSHLFERSLANEARLRYDLDSGLRRALERGEFFLLFQPIVHMASGRTAQVEALIRWDHPERGVVAPEKFIPMAEENGLIVPMGNWVLRTACRQLLAIDPGDDGLGLCVNVAPRQLAEPDFVTTVEAILAETGFPPGRLTLELTESGASQRVPGLVGRLETLTALGIGLSLDDFGTGFSSLSLLQELPLSNLKVDRSFVARMSASDKDLALVRLTIEMAHALDLEVTAEGVEDARQEATLREMGCDQGQGFFFDRPLAPASLTDRLTSEASDLSAVGRFPSSALGRTSQPGIFTLR